MLFYYLDTICKGAFWATLLIFACAGYAYRVNARRPDDDPKKRDFRPSAIFLAPFTWPLLFVFWLSLLSLRALVYGIFLILFTVALVAFQESDVPDWLSDKLAWIGNKLLEANTFLIKIAFGGWEKKPQPI